MNEDALGAILARRRAELFPKDVGLPDTLGRRVPGLRRTEVALLAGVSVGYYARLEQGASRRPSARILESVARALRLAPSARSELLRFAAHSEGVGRQPAVRSGLTNILECIGSGPAIIVNAATDVLAWNDLARALIADFPSLELRHRNLARLVFLEPDPWPARVSWESAALDAIGILRANASRDVHHRGLTEVMGELTLRSGEFCRLWASTERSVAAHGRRGFCHPAVGELELDFETLDVPGHPRYTLLVYTSGSRHSSVRSLANLLGSLAVSEMLDSSQLE